MLWAELCSLISKNPKEIKSLDVDAIMRSALRRYTDQIGALWTSLADYYVRSGLFERVKTTKLKTKIHKILVKRTRERVPIYLFFVLHTHGYFYYLCTGSGYL